MEIWFSLPLFLIVNLLGNEGIPWLIRYTLQWDSYPKELRILIGREVPSVGDFQESGAFDM